MSEPKPGEYHRSKRTDWRGEPDEEAVLANNDVISIHGSYEAAADA